MPESIGPQKVHPLPKQPPHSIEAEQSVLGGLMLDNRMFEEVAERVRAEDFYRADHQMIFAAIERMARARMPCDFVTLSEHLRNDGKLEEAGGVAYLGSLAVDTYSVSNVLHYADIIRERALLRGLIAAGAEIAEMGYRPGGRNVEAVVSEAERLVLGVRDRGEVSTQLPPDVEQLCGPWVDHLERVQRGDAPPGLSTGLIDLDKKTTGLHPGDFVVIGARPAMGKTALALGIADLTAANGGHAAVFSMEMPKEQLVSRIVSSRARVNLERMRSPGQMDESDFQHVTQATAGLRGITIDDRSGRTADQICATALRIHRRKRLRLIAIDYLQLMQGMGEENRTRELETASHAFKTLAKDLGIPVIALAQVNRGCELRAGNKRPTMADLRDCGAIEADADLVIFIYRDEVYDENSRDKGTAELIVAKQRNGPIGMVRVAAMLHQGRFENLSPDWARAPEPEQPRRRGFRSEPQLPFSEPPERAQ